MAPLRLLEGPAPGAWRAAVTGPLAGGGEGQAPRFAAAAGPRGWETARAVVGAWAGVARPHRVVLASPRSLCAGVERAIQTVQALLDRSAGGRVFVRKQIVHNTHVVDELEGRGAVFVDELDQVPDGAIVVFSAHGVSPAVRAEAVRRGLTVVDATCPLVTKVHSEARRFAARGDTIILIGHAGHEETEGTLGEAPEATVLVEDAAQVAALKVADAGRVSYLTQTTLAVDETAAVIAALRARFPKIKGPGSEDICYATTNRQHALAAVAEQVELVLVVGSVNSSNSRRMAEVAARAGAPAYLIEDAAGIRPQWIEYAATIGLSAGASAPPALVDQVIDALGGLGPVTVTEHTTAVETVNFAPPAAVRTT
ncbi:4-hydroxy-3-methylbut-2-enyl diphosphate reductase [Streptomyces sp. NPDC048384]|uniref:4-hydroxy-3-methylbut-2-enyl diphosphate reductase n=1 Tax=Streptomyces sp. NPDC048384 TaxID=3155487 RepID=UPI0034316D66